MFVGGWVDGAIAGLSLKLTDSEAAALTSGHERELAGSATIWVHLQPSGWVAWVQLCWVRCKLSGHPNWQLGRETLLSRSQCSTLREWEGSLLQSRPGVSHRCSVSAEQGRVCLFFCHPACRAHLGQPFPVPGLPEPSWGLAPSMDAS